MVRRGAGRRARRGAVAVVTGIALLLSGCGTSSSGRADDATVRTRALAESSPSLDRIASGAQRMAAVAWPRSESVWPGSDYTDRVLILVDGNEARLVTVDGVRRTSPAELRSEKVTVPPSQFAPARWHGRPAMVFVVSESSLRSLLETTGTMDAPTAVFTVATHEMFHAFDQNANPTDPASLSKMWPSILRAQAGDGGLRATPYPVEVEPRLYRAALFDALGRAYLHPRRREEHLREAAYWWLTWQARAPREKEQTLFPDISEGTAQYVEGAMLAVADAERPTEARSLMSKYYIDSQPSRPWAPDKESYGLGMLSGLILDDQGEKWKPAMARGGRTPVDLLLSDVPAQQADLPERIDGRYRTMVEKHNDQVTKDITPAVDAYQDRSRSLLRIPSKGSAGSGAGADTYLPTGTPPVMAGQTQTVDLRSGKLVLKNQTVFQQGKYLVVPIDPNDPATHLSGSTVKLDGPGLTGTVRVSAGKQGNRTTLTAI